MQPVGVAASLHDTARLLIHDFHLIVDDDVLHVLLEHAVRLEQLVDGMHPFGFDGIFVDEFVLFGRLLLGAQVALLDFGHGSTYVGQHEESLLADVAGEEFMPLVGQLHRIEFLVDNEEELVGNLRHTPVVVLHVGVLHLLHQRLIARLTEELDERFVFGQSLVGAVKQYTALVVLSLADELAGSAEQVVHEVALHVVELFDEAAVLVEELVVPLGYGTRYDERGTGVVDEHGVHFVHDGEVMLALHEVLRLNRHIIPQIVEAELVVRTKGDIGQVGLAPGGGVGLVVVDAVHRKAVEFVHGPHPLRVAAGEVVVHRNDVYALAGQRVQKYRECSHERLTLARRHLGDTPLVKHDAAEKLHVVVYHVPRHGVASCYPTVGIDGLVALYRNEILRGGQVAVELRRGDLYRRVFRETAGGGLHDGERLGQYLVQLLFYLVVDILRQFVYLARMALLVLQRGFRLFEYSLQFGYPLLVGAYLLCDITAQGSTAGTQFVVRQGVYLRVEREYPVHIGLYLLAVLVALGSEKCLDYFR